MEFGSDHEKLLALGVLFILIMIGIGVLFRPCDLSLSFSDGIRYNCRTDPPLPSPSPDPLHTQSPRPGPSETGVSPGPGRTDAPRDNTPPQVQPSPTGGSQSREQTRPPANFAWQMNEFARLDPPQGYTWYDVRDTVATPQTALVRIPDEDWPRLEDLEVGNLLVATGYKNIRRRPVESSRMLTLEPDSCVRVIEGRRYYFDQQTGHRSSGWLPVEQATCPE